MNLQEIPRFKEDLSLSDIEQELAHIHVVFYKSDFLQPPYVVQENIRHA